MEKKYLAKIIANDQEGLQMISACMAGAKTKISDMKYLKANKIFLQVCRSITIFYGRRICSSKTYQEESYFPLDVRL